MTPTERGAAAMRVEMERWVTMRHRISGEFVVQDLQTGKWDFTGTREQCETWRYERAFAAGQEAMWVPIKTAPEDERVLLATSGGWVGEAELLLTNAGTTEWRWIMDQRPVHENLKLLGWQPLPPPPTANTGDTP